MEPRLTALSKRAWYSTTMAALSIVPLRVKISPAMLTVMDASMVVVPAAGVRFARCTAVSAPAAFGSPSMVCPLAFRALRGLPAARGRLVLLVGAVPAERVRARGRVGVAEDDDVERGAG